MKSKEVTPEEVLQYDKPTKAFLCPLSANVYNIQFLSFRIRDMITNTVLFEIKRDKQEAPTPPPPVVTGQAQPGPGDGAKEEEMKQGIPVDQDELRKVRYYFGPEFFKLKTIGTSLEFSVGSLPVKKFRMIERHYFKDKLLKSYDFTFPFCPPNSTNNWESIYDVPPLTPEQQADMIANPWQTISDSFYFVENQLIMHNKAEYSYSVMDDEEVRPQDVKKGINPNE